jgi:predicted nucleotidyltransferase
MKSIGSSGDARVDGALAALILRVESLLPDAGLGFYLHGSRAASATRPDSDVDVLALATRPFSDEQRREARKIAAELGPLS